MIWPAGTKKPHQAKVDALADAGRLGQQGTQTIPSSLSLRDLGQSCRRVRPPPLLFRRAASEHVPLLQAEHVCGAELPTPLAYDPTSALQGQSFASFWAVSPFHIG